MARTYRQILNALYKQKVPVTCCRGISCHVSQARTRWTSRTFKLQPASSQTINASLRSSFPLIRLAQTICSHAFQPAVKKDERPSVLCSECEELYPFREVDTFFDLFGFSKSFDIDKGLLRRKYLKMVDQTHPDKYASLPPVYLSSFLPEFFFLHFSPRPSL